jgi:hypothetical protein
MTPEFDIAMSNAKVAYVAFRTHVRACSVCIPWWGGASPGCEVGRKHAYEMHKTQGDVERLVFAEIAGPDPIKWTEKCPKDFAAGRGIHDGTLPIDAPGYWRPGYPKETPND